MITTALLLAKGRSEHHIPAADGHATHPATIPSNTGPLDARYFDAESNARIVYHVQRVPLGLSVSYGAGVMSGLLGVGGGFIKVPAMNLVMVVPIKMAAATSSFMIGVTAVSSLLVYLGRGGGSSGCDDAARLGNGCR